MELINNMNKNINELNERFSLILENFVPNYILSLKYPNNTKYTEETNHVFNTIQNINSSAFLLMNDMHSEIDKENKITMQSNTQMDQLKKQNEAMKHKLKKLKAQAITAEGMFDNLLDWYKEQLVIIVVMIIGILLGFYFLKTLNMNKKQWVISLTIMFLVGYVINQIISYIFGVNLT
jgi:hypothetical protein